MTTTKALCTANSVWILATRKKYIQVKYCGGTTTNLMQHLKLWHKEDHKAAKVEEEKMGGKKESILHHFGTQK